MEMIKTRVTVEFYGRVKNSKGITQKLTDRRTITLPKCFDMGKAKAQAGIALLEVEGQSPAYENVRVDRVAFN